MKITVLMENTAVDPILTAEHGLSLYIETSSHKILFDAGQSDAFADNAEKLGIDLQAIDFAVLSHGHYDHSGGLKRFLECTKTAPVYVNEHAFAPCYHGNDRYIGIDPALQGCERLTLVGDEYQIAPGLTLLSCNKKDRPYPTDSFGLTVFDGNAYTDDTFTHEHYLLIEENSKKVLISGCSHKGILNIVSWFQPDVLIGGFHFMNLDPATSDAERLKDAAKLLLQSPTVYYTGHCTGEAQFDYMKAIMGDRLLALSGGRRFEL
ncbi:MAG: MBL fold metallo-hydrolase [Oscillospiraceae bacterium]|nr:MBL fold metallo-hydrolase [Oscillospiraceae bacterium]